MAVEVRAVERGDEQAWCAMRTALWPEGSPAEHAAEAKRFLAGRASEPLAVLVAQAESGELVGFVELSIRPHAEGCHTDRVAYLEGWFVAPA